MAARLIEPNCTLLRVTTGMCLWTGVKETKQGVNMLNARSAEMFLKAPEDEQRSPLKGHFRGAARSRLFQIQSKRNG